MYVARQFEGMAVQETEGLERPQDEIARLSAHTVVDTDIHEIVRDKSDFAAYLESPWKEKVTHQLRTDEPLARGFTGTLPIDIDPQPYGLGEDVTPLTPAGIDAFMDQFNTDYALLHGSMIETITIIPEKEFAAALCAAYNDFLLEQYLDEFDGLKSLIRVAPQAPERAVEEIDRLADESEMHGVHIPAAPPNRLLGDSVYEPIFEAADDHGLPISIHPASTNLPWAGMWGGPSLESSAEIHSVLSNSTRSHIPSLIFQGIPEKYPNLEFVVLEQGVSWLPGIQGRMDRAYERREHELPWLEKKPSEYLRNQFYFGTQPMEDVAGPGQLMKILDTIDAGDMLVYSSDWPHFDFDYPSMLTIPHLEEEVERKIFGGNAMDVFDI